MGKKKTVFVWILLVLLAVYLIRNAIGTVAALLLDPTANIVVNVMSIVGLVIQAIFFFKLYNVTPDVLTWVNIAFGYTFATILLGFVLWMSSERLAAIGLFRSLATIIVFVSLVVIGAMWFGISLHLKRAKRDNLMDFS